MSPLEDLQARADALLTRTESTATVEAKVASTEGPSRRFSPFIPSELDRAIALAGELMRIAAAEGGTAGAALRARPSAGPASRTSSSSATRSRCSSSTTRRPRGSRSRRSRRRRRSARRRSSRARSGASRRSTGSARTRWATTTTATGTSSTPRAAAPGRGGVQLQDRQGELFFYMHQQMLARYDAERRALGFGPVVPFADYREPIGEGYEDRPSGQALRDVDRADTGLLQPRRPRVPARPAARRGRPRAWPRTAPARGR